MSIAERRGYKTVREMGQDMTHAEYLEWIAYYQYRDREKRKLPPLMDEEAQIQYDINQMMKTLS